MITGIERGEVGTSIPHAGARARGVGWGAVYP